MKTYTAIIEKCNDTGMFVGYIPGLPGAHTQAESLDELQRNLREVIELALSEGKPNQDSEFFGTQSISIG